MKRLTHVDHTGRAHMVDVGNKDVVKRNAKATGFIRLAPETLSLIRENKIKKGDVLTVAEIAGIQAAKQTSVLIPLCHNLSLDSVHVNAVISEDGVTITSEANCTGKTGVEMEALTAVSVALLTVYDMCKAVDMKMQITEIRLIEKSKLPIQA